MSAETRQPQDAVGGMVAGLLLGAAAGLGLLVWETLVLRLAHVGFAPGDLLGRFALGYVAAGAGVGFLSAALGARGARWGTGAAWMAVGLLTAPVGGALATALGLPAVVGVIVPPTVGAVVGVGLARVTLPAWLHLGTAAWIWCSLALLGPLEHHLLAGSSAEVLACAGIAVTMAFALAAFTAAFAVEGGAPVVPVLSWAALGGLLLGLLSVRPEPAAPIGDHRADPIVFVVVSGVRVDHTSLGRAPADPSATPALDALGDEALVFEQAFATSNWTAPALASLLTARMPYRHRAGRHDGQRQLHSALAPDVQTLPTALGQAGFVTGAAVGAPGLRRYGLERGFDVWQEDLTAGARPALWRVLEATGSVEPWPTVVDAATVTDRALAFVERQGPTGWFLLAHYADPAQLDPALDYTAALRGVDEEIARLLAAVPPDTWVVFVGAHGRDLGVSGPDRLRTTRGVPYGDHLYDDVLQVPLWMRLPTLVPGRVAEPVSIIDVAPTVLAALPRGPLARADGTPLEPVFGLPLADRVVLAHASRFGQELQRVTAFGHDLMLSRDGRVRMYARASEDAQAVPMPTTPEHDDLKRQLLSALPPPGGERTAEDVPFSVRLGQLGSRLLGRR